MTASLNPQQLQTARMIYGLALGRGLRPEQAREVVAAAYAESGLNPQATNHSSGAAGLFQLLSPGYRQRAQSLGGLYNPQANTKAILGDYASFFQTHPGAAPGAAGAAVERSGQGAGFYANPLSLLSGLGGAVSPSQPASSPGVPSPAPAPSSPSPALTQALLASLLHSQSGQPLNLGFLPRLPPPGEAAAPPDATATGAGNAGQRSHSSRTPINYSKIIGLPYQGSHATAFNVRGGSNNWQSENALDLAAPVGTPVYAVASGTIGSNIGPQGRGGRFAGSRVQIDANGNAFWYGHLSRVVVKAGQRVRAGQLLGYSGEANGVAHLHFAAEHGDPRRYVG